MTIFEGKDDLLKYVKLLNKNKIYQTDNLLTAWNFFSNDNPGEIILYEKDGKTIYDVVERLKQTSNLYFAEQRGD